MENHKNLSYDNLGKRLGKRLGIKKTSRSKTGQRLIDGFIGFGVLKMLEKGTQHSKRGAGKATLYKWLLSD